MSDTWIRRCGAAGVAVAAVGLVVGCSATPAGPQTVTRTTTPTSAGAGADDAADDFARTPADPSAKRCTKLKVTLGESAMPVEGAADQFRVSVVFTNRGGVTCVLRGFPGARFDGADGTSWDLVRTNDAITSVTLGPDGQASSTLTFLASDNATGWHVRTLSVTPPNTTDTQQVAWPQGPVLKQDGATHPGSYLAPIKGQGR
jgi:hypothetical protein